MRLHRRIEIKRYWGPAALAGFVFLWMAALWCKVALGLSLRSVPRIAMTWLGVTAISAFFLWGNMRLRGVTREEKPGWVTRLMGCVVPVSILCVVFMFFLALAVSGMIYHPEHVVEKNGYRLTARVHSFLDEYVYYYQYNGPLFYGREMGYEYYGSGSGDPLSRTPAPEPEGWAFYDSEGNVIESGPQEQTQLDIGVLENRTDELVFDISIDDYIDIFNRYYEQDHGRSYLTPSAQWSCHTRDQAIHSQHETRYYYFTENEKAYSLPTITVYAPTNEDYIQQITVNFDQHSYTDSVYELYEQMCFYTLKVFFPELSDETIVELYTQANELGLENVFSSDDWYSSDSVPCALFCKDGIGVYPYFAIGDWQHLCIIPVTRETIEDFEHKGVQIHEIA